MSTTEWWQRGPVDDVPAMLQPVAHMLLQIHETVHDIVAPLTEAQWNARPVGLAPAVFHVRHITGVLDRLFTYARGEVLSEAQFSALREEDAPIALAEVPPLLQRFDARIESSLAELKAIDPAIFGDFRGVGRAQLPSTVIGCLVHGAEHGMRHVGQLLVTARVVSAQAGN